MTPEEIEKLTKQGRDFMHMPIEDPSFASDQQQKKPQPPLYKDPMTSQSIALPSDFSSLEIDPDFLHIVNCRASHRAYGEKPISLLQLSYLLWCSQGVKYIKGQNYCTIRTVPCGGSRHEFECYMTIQNVTGLEDGFYHYLPSNHSIELLKQDSNLKEWIGPSLGGQVWANKANVVFYYSMVAYRAEWRYGIYAHRVALIDAGHITENVYLAATSINLGACALGYIDEAICNKPFGCDGTEEFIFYACPVGTLTPDNETKEKEVYAALKAQEAEKK